MATGNDFDYIRSVDLDQLASTPLSERYVQMLLDVTSGARHCTISYIRTPVGEGSPAGMHSHEVDQIFLVLSGTMSVEIGGTTFSADAGTLVIFPAGVHHRNWNQGDGPTVHVAINVPLPDPSKPFSKTVPITYAKGAESAAG